MSWRGLVDTLACYHAIWLGGSAGLSFFPFPFKRYIQIALMIIKELFGLGDRI
jgi:hypothetical protein